MKQMIPLEEALTIVLDRQPTIVTETIDFRLAQNRILAEDIFSDIDMPPFNKSAMDGFACRMQDIAHELTIIETVAAGQFPRQAIRPDTCTRIMTGAPVPEGADCVLMVEHTEKVKENTIRFLKDQTKSNIVLKANDISKGDLVLGKGTLIKPQHTAVLASVGATKIKVAKQPRVGILSTGSEIVEPENKPGISQIRNSNGYQLIGQVEQSHAIANYGGIVPDNEEATYNAIKKGLEENDILLLTGGVSMGDFDFVPQIMEQLGIEIKFRKLAVQPGKPTTFGLKGKKYIFGLPGNPVSSFMQFELLVKPLIYQLMGHQLRQLHFTLPFGCDHQRNKTERMAFFPVKIEESKIYPLDYHGSAHIHGLQHADAICWFPIGQQKFNKGDLAHVRFI